MINFTQPPKSLCIFRLSAIGDVTHILPVIHTLKKAWPETHISWVIGKLEYQLVKDFPGIEFIVFDKSSGLKAYAQLRRQLKGRQFDVLLMMQAALRASIASLMIPAHHRLGFDRARAIDYQWLFSNQRIAGEARVHVLEGFFQFLQALGLEQKVLIWDLPELESNAQFASQHIADRPTVIINPCSSARKNNWRNWKVERYAAIVDYLQDKAIQVFITGGPSPRERQFCNELSACCQSRPNNLAGQTTLGQLLALIRRAKFIIAPDTGPAHMASIVDTPVIGLFASSNPARTGPYKSQHSLVNRYPEALQQYKHKSLDQAGWGERVRDPEVMDLISVEDVQQRIDQVLGKQTN